MARDMVAKAIQVWRNPCKEPFGNCTSGEVHLWSNLENRSNMATASQPVILRLLISIRGIVQGVGFRPFVFNLAESLGIRGFVLNTSSGITIEGEGEEDALDKFLLALRSDAPPLARIEELSTFKLLPAGSTRFEILESKPVPGEFVLVSPDTATCDECLGDVTDPGNRRYGYPFTNCTNCGPRYTIIRDIPYDRPATTMADFRMCERCEAEYHDPSNRRFHAQPNACAVCGPEITLAKAGSFLPDEAAYKSGEPSLSVLSDVRRRLREGSIVAVKGLGGFQLACDAENDVAVRQLRQRKKRSDKPFALMVRDIVAAEAICELSDADRELLLSRERPIVILRRRDGTRLSSAISPNNNTVGVMLPYTPLHSLLFGAESDFPPEFPALVMTSGNISDEPIVTSNKEAWQRLDRVADWFLFHNRDIYMRVDDSVARPFAGAHRLLRRSRGYAPRPIDLGSTHREVLAVGAELKNAFCFTKDHYAILSQHVGDVDNYETLEFFRETLARLTKTFRAVPEAVAYDLHPHYLTFRFAQELPLRRIGVQHHHAHIASCMAENRLAGKVIGVAFDGTGYGTDGNIWGGEFLVADFAAFERRAHLRYIPLAGGDAAVRQPWRPALAWLRDTFGNRVPDLPMLRGIESKQLAIVSRMMETGLNTVQTSSCGRLFDAVAAIIGLRHEVTFEGQAAIELESIALPGVEEHYSFLIEEREPLELDMRPTIEAIVGDQNSGRPAALIASCFHNTVTAAAVEICRRIRHSDGLKRVCLSGGTFQNVYLVERLVRLLQRDGFDVFLHSIVPPNDGGISLGQAAIASEILNSGA